MMQAVCFTCGSEKPGPLSPCGHCCATPRSKDELSLSLILCRQLSPQPQLTQFAHQIQSGHGLNLAEGMVAKVRDALKHPQIAAMLRVGHRMGRLSDTA